MSFTFLNLLFLSFLLFSLANVTRALESESLITDDLGKIEDFKYMVSVDVDGYLCGGSIVDDDIIVTAAHCFYDSDGNLVKNFIKITAGVDDLKDFKSPTRVVAWGKEVYLLKSYMKNRGKDVGDIAVLKLRQPLDLKNNRNLRKLELTDTKYNDKQPILTGFGHNKLKFVRNPKNKTSIESSRDGKLRYSKTNIIPKNLCQREYTNRRFFFFHSKVIKIEPSHVCARVIQPGVPGNTFKFDEEVKHFRGACTGDSGSPLVVDGKILIGVLSFNDFTCNEGKAPSVYSSVLYYKKFIESVIDNKYDPKTIHKETVNIENTVGTVIAQ